MGDGFTCLQLCFFPSSDGSCFSLATTLCTASLPHLWAQPECVPATQARMLPLPLWSLQGDCNLNLPLLPHCSHVHWGMSVADCVCVSCFCPSPVLPAYSDTPSFLRLSAPTFQTWLCVTQGILCCIIVVQIVTLKEETIMFSHDTMMLVSFFMSSFISKLLGRTNSRGT